MSDESSLPEKIARSGETRREPRRGQERFTRGYCWEGDDPAEVRDVVEAAFDYRGDVTITLRSGSEITAYVSNRDLRAEDPFIEVFPADGSPRQRFLYRDIRGIAFTGKDTASGKSWETWVKTWNVKKEAEARGEEVGDIGLYPEEE